MQKIPLLLFAGIPFSFHGVELIIPLGIFWIAMLADCLHFNKSLPFQQKFLWALALLFVAPIGTILYFFIVFLGRFFAPKNLRKPTMQDKTYSGYEQGYQHTPPVAYQPPQPSPFATKENDEQGSSFPLYEQPQASYPEQPDRS